MAKGSGGGGRSGRSGGGAFNEISFGVMGTNTPDRFVGARGLVSSSGEPVTISREGPLGGFVINIGGRRTDVGPNLMSAAIVLNRAGVGRIR